MIATYVGMGLPTAALGVAWPSMRAERRPAAVEPGPADRGLHGGLPRLDDGPRVGRSPGRAPARCSSSPRSWPRVAAGVFADRPARGRSSWSAAAVLGVSGGVVDAALNAHVALYHSDRMMNLMHGGFGVGATLGPLVMTALIGAGLSWRWGYGALAVLQLGLAVAFATTRRQWPAARSGPRPGTPRRPARCRRPRGSVRSCSSPTARSRSGVGAWAFVLLTDRGLGDDRGRRLRHRLLGRAGSRSPRAGRARGPGSRPPGRGRRPSPASPSARSRCGCSRRPLRRSRSSPSGPAWPASSRRSPP